MKFAQGRGRTLQVSTGYSFFEDQRVLQQEFAYIKMFKRQILVTIFIDVLVVHSSHAHPHINSARGSNKKISGNGQMETKQLISYK